MQMMKVRSFLSAFLSMSVLVASMAGTVFAQAGADAIRSEVERRLRENKKKVVIETRDGRKVKANITSAGTDSFTIVENKSTQSITIAYADILRLTGTGWSTGAKIGLAAGIGGGITALILYVAFQRAIRNN
jgi:hypothetical protein